MAEKIETISLNISGEKISFNGTPEEIAFLEKAEEICRKKIASFSKQHREFVNSERPKYLKSIMVAIAVDLAYSMDRIERMENQLEEINSTIKKYLSDNNKT